MDIELQNTLSKYGQNHIVEFSKNLNSEQNKNLIEEINSLDLKKIKTLFGDLCLKKENHNHNSVKIEPLEISGRCDDSQAITWIKEGENILRNSQAAAFLVAGGQGSRLGFDGPKGMYNISLPSQKSIFQIQAEKIICLQKNYQCTIPWYIMTSPLNNDATINFFKKNNYFGLDQNNIIFFMQGMIPALDSEGKILMESEAKMALVPDGNGGCFKALSDSGALDDMKKRGIKFINLYSVDNVLIKICDPLFMGFIKSQGAPSASKVISKASPDEKVGLFAKINDAPGVIEYSDISDEMRNEVDQNNNLKFDGANIAVHAFSIEALEKIAQKNLPYHIAHKKVNYYSCNDKSIISPIKENAWKFEQFLFDAFPMLGRMDTLLVRREQEFAPVKNAEGNDSPESARKLIGKLHRSFLSGYSKLNNDKYYEIDWKLTYAGEGLDSNIIEKAFAEGNIKEFDN